MNENANRAGETASSHAASSGVEIIPAVMPRSLADLKEKMSLVKGLVPLVQIDVMDGVFVLEAGWPYTAGGPQEFSKFSDEGEGLPLWKDIDVEADLMVSDPRDVIDDWLRAGAKRVVVHVEGVEDVPTLLSELSASFAGDHSAIGMGELGLALNIDTSLDRITPFVEAVDFIQFMGIARIGFQEEPFDERVIEKIKRLRGKHPDTIISVDGGVHLDSTLRLLEAGANRLVVGSAIFESGDIKGTIEKFKHLNI